MMIRGLTDHKLIAVDDMNPARQVQFNMVVGTGGGQRFDPRRRCAKIERRRPKSLLEGDLFAVSRQAHGTIVNNKQLLSSIARPRYQPVDSVIKRKDDCQARAQIVGRAFDARAVDLTKLIDSNDRDRGWGPDVGRFGQPSLAINDSLDPNEHNRLRVRVQNLRWSKLPAALSSRVFDICAAPRYRHSDERKQHRERQGSQILRTVAEAGRFSVSIRFHVPLRWLEGLCNQEHFPARALAL
ncbi:MAG: hypothetical protein K1X71_20410 [Pirellulales bacterium]|nr:hypothetical protein [Pirellulales bacterium]